MDPAGKLIDKNDRITINGIAGTTYAYAITLSTEYRSVKGDHKFYVMKNLKERVGVYGLIGDDLISKAEEIEGNFELTPRNKNNKYRKKAERLDIIPEVFKANIDEIHERYKTLDNKAENEKDRLTHNDKIKILSKQFNISKKRIGKALRRYKGIENKDEYDNWVFRKQANHRPIEWFNEAYKTIDLKIFLTHKEFPLNHRNLTFKELRLIVGVEDKIAYKEKAIISYSIVDKIRYIRFNKSNNFVVKAKQIKDKNIIRIIANNSIKNTNWCILLEALFKIDSQNDAKIYIRAK